MLLGYRLCPPYGSWGIGIMSRVEPRSLWVFTGFVVNGTCVAFQNLLRQLGHGSSYLAPRLQPNGAVAGLLLRSLK